MNIRPLSEALGAEVVGLDLIREPAAEAVETPRRAFLDHPVGARRVHQRLLLAGSRLTA